jgi:hypothetical protein
LPVVIKSSSLADVRMGILGSRSHKTMQRQ